MIVLRRFSCAAFLTIAAFGAGVLVGWMLNENERECEFPGGG